jgi:hypothetical protein
MSGKTTASSTRKDQAFVLLDSMRGRYIVSQALHYGIQELKRIPAPYQETSNLMDMTLLREELFNFPIQDNWYTLDLAIVKAKEEGLIE